VLEGVMKKRLLRNYRLYYTTKIWYYTNNLIKAGRTPKTNLETNNKFMDNPQPVNPVPSSSSKKKVELLIGLTVLLIAILFVLVKIDQNNTRKLSKQTQQTQLPPVQKTSDVDEVATGIIADLEADASIAASGDEDINDINSNGALIGNVYNENEY
jgi:hypothetical protein